MLLLASSLYAQAPQYSTTLKLSTRFEAMAYLAQRDARYSDRQCGTARVTATVRGERRSEWPHRDCERKTLDRGALISHVLSSFAAFSGLRERDSFNFRKDQTRRNHRHRPDQPHHQPCTSRQFRGQMKELCEGE